MQTQVVVLGGGTGTSMAIRALRPYTNIAVTALLSMADDGGSTGVLRKAYGVLPGGDARQCLAAASSAAPEILDMFTYRFADGPLAGHAVGNILLAALERTADGMDKALTLAGALLQAHARVLPTTTDHVVLGLRNAQANIEIHGEHAIDASALEGDKWDVFFSPDRPTVHQPALDALRSADALLLGPGSIFTSTLAALLPDIRHEIRTCRAKIIIAVNAVGTTEQTGHWTAADYVHTIERALGRRADHILFNTSPLPEGVAANVRATPLGRLTGDMRVVALPLLESSAPTQAAGDALQRTPVKHDAARFGAALYALLH